MANKVFMKYLYLTYDPDTLWNYSFLCNVTRLTVFENSNIFQIQEAFIKATADQNCFRNLL